MSTARTRRNTGIETPKQEPLIVRGGALRSLDALRAKLPGWLTPINVLAALFLVWYWREFYLSIAPYWFNPGWTTDDALQQSFPLYKALNPSLFQGDLITEVMEGYLAPLHYWLSYGFTLLTGSPILAGHWVHAVQLFLSLGFLFFAVKRLAGFAPACFGVAWMLHTRHVMQRLTGGLPRGWALPVLCAYLFFVIRGSHRGVLITLLLGCLAHPPSTLICGFAYGLLLLYRVARKETRAANMRPFLTLVALAPLYAVVTFSVVKRPEHIGQMVSYEEATQMPEFQRPLGRFPFVPLKSAGFEIRSFGFQAFSTRWHSASRFVKHNLWWMVVTFSVAVVAFGSWRRRKVLPAELATYLVAIFTIYAASRQFAFKLYVPDRHLQFPLAVFFIVFLCGAVWHAFALRDETRIRRGELGAVWPSLLGAVALSSLIWVGSGWGLKGAANFNYPISKKGGVFEWLRKNSPEDSLVAGHPTHLDALQLFAMRQGYATTETAHPFYPKYYAEIKRRLEISLKAHYAQTLQGLYDLLAPEGIDYFVFKRDEFYPEGLQAATYHAPLDTLMRELASRPVEDYAYRQLPRNVNLEKYPFMPFRDAQSVVVDVKKLGEYLQEHRD